MSANLENYHEPVRRIADEFLTACQRANNKPLCRLKEYLEALEECAERLTNFLLKVEKLAVVTALICFFIWGAVRLLISLHA